MPDKKVLAKVIIHSIYISVISTLFLTGEINMNVLFEILKVAIPAAISSGVALHLSRKTQLNNLSQKFDELKGEIERIERDIGRGDNSTLTKQHEFISKEINKNYSEIKDRFYKEDEAYRLFSIEQRDLKSTMVNFSRDYQNLIERNHILGERIIVIEDEYKKALGIINDRDIEIKELKKKNQELIKQHKRTEIDTRGR